MCLNALLSFILSFVTTQASSVNRGHQVIIKFKTYYILLNNSVRNKNVSWGRNFKSHYLVAALALQILQTLNITWLIDYIWDKGGEHVCFFFLSSQCKKNGFSIYPTQETKPQTSYDPSLAQLNHTHGIIQQHTHARTDAVHKLLPSHFS